MELGPQGPDPGAVLGLVVLTAAPPQPCSARGRARRDRPSGPFPVGHEDQDLTATELLARFERWPTWMWANREVAEFLTWLREWNRSRSEPDRVGVYGLDVYSPWDSLRIAISWVEAHAPDALPGAMRAWQCFLPYGEDPQRYAWSTRLVPESCEEDVVALLAEVRRRTQDRLVDEDAFDAALNAEAAAGAEHYYRAMVRGDHASWNIRDHHMADTMDRIAARSGPRSKGLVWEHNTHVGDARATDMAAAGLVNVGQWPESATRPTGSRSSASPATVAPFLRPRVGGNPSTCSTSPVPVPAVMRGSCMPHWVVRPC